MVTNHFPFFPTVEVPENVSSSSVGTVLLNTSSPFASFRMIWQVPPSVVVTSKLTVACSSELSQTKENVPESPFP